MMFQRLTKAMRFVPLFAPVLVGASGEFLSVPAGARNMALGDTGLFSSYDSLGLFWNPAALARTPPTSLSLGHVPYLDTTVFDHVALSRNMGSKGTVAAGAILVSYGAISSVDEEGLPAGSLSPQDQEWALGYARHFPAWPGVGGGAWGVAAKSISSTIVGSERTWAVDGGLLSRPFFGGRACWAASVSQLGPGLGKGEEKEALPRCVRGGVSYRFSPRWFVVTEGARRRGEPFFVGMGMEHERTFKGEWAFAFRGGYTTRDSLARETAPVVGLGVGWKGFRMDYFFRGFGGDISIQGMTLSARWAEKGRRLPPALQSLVNEGLEQLEGGQYPEAALTFYKALKMDPRCAEARDGLEEADRRMGGR